MNNKKKKKEFHIVGIGRGLIDSEGIFESLFSCTQSLNVGKGWFAFVYEAIFIAN